MRHETPEDLFARYLRAGDEDALDALFRRASPRLRGFAMRLCLPADRIEELVHETLVTAVQRADTFAEGAPLLPWLQGILARKAAAFHRDETRRRLHHARHATAADTEREPIDEAAADELRELLQQAIGALPTRYREVVDLHLRHGLQPAEIAARLDRLVVTVRVHLHRGLRELRRQLPRGLFPLALALWFAGEAPAAALPWPPGPRRGFVRPTLLAAAAVATATLVWMSWPTPAPAAAGPVAAALPQVATAPARVPDAPEPPALREPVAANAPGTPHELSITVLDAAGAPLPHVGVVVEPATTVEALSRRRRARTDAQGLATVVVDGTLPLRVRSDRGHDERIAAETTHLVWRAAGRDLQVTVLDPEGRPLPDLDVWLAPSPAGAGCGGNVARTDGDGRCGLRGVPRGAIVAASGAGFATPPEAVDGSGTTTLRASSARAVTGRVVANDGPPIAGAVVGAGVAPEFTDTGYPDGVAMWPWPPLVTETAADGSFGPLWLPPGTSMLFARAPGRAPGNVPLADGVGTAGEAVIRLAPARPVRGTVVDERGEPLPDAELVFRSSDRDHRIDVRSGSAGAFALDLPDAAGVLCARRAGHSPCRVLIPTGAAPGPLRLVLAAAPVFAIRLLEPDGGPAVGWQLRCKLAARSALDAPPAPARSDADGGILLPFGHDDAERAEFSVRAPGDPVWHELDDRAATELRRGSLRLPGALRPSASLEGRCLDGSGHPIAAARVFLRCDRGVAWEAAQTDGDGRFRAPHLAPGRYFVFAESQNAAQPCTKREDVDVPPDTATAVELRAAACGTLTYHVRCGEHTPEALVSVVGGNPSRRYLARPAAVGEQVLPVGSYRLYAMGEDFAWVDGEPFEIRAEQSTRLELDVEPAARTALALRGDLPPLDAPFTVHLLRRSDGRAFGSFELLPDAIPCVTAFLPPGDYRLEARGEAGTAFAIGDCGIDPSHASTRAVEVWLHTAHGR